MTKKNNIEASSLPSERIIGKYIGESGGPTVICIAGLHGNEPAGVLALERVFSRLEECRPSFRGELVGIAGNIQALRKGARFIQEDLNRMWQPDVIAGLSSSGGRSGNCVFERAERRDLINALVELCTGKNTPLYFLDLHTTSAEGGPFMTIADTLRNRKFTDNFPVPRILGIEEQLDSTLLNYINEIGYVAVGFEAGQHEAQSSVDNCEAAVWIMMASSGLIPDGDIRLYGDPYHTLKIAAANNSGVYEVRYRHDVNTGDGFSMNLGFTNFQRIKKGELLAHDKSGEIRAGEGGNLFMPLYQKQGNDGFFIIRLINPLWLGISVMLRKLRLERYLTYLPGFESLDGRPGALTVDLNVARWNVIELLHLLGYRKKFTSNGKLYASRRKFDIDEPSDYRFPIGDL